MTGIEEIRAAALEAAAQVFEGQLKPQGSVFDEDSVLKLAVKFEHYIYYGGEPR